MGNPNIPGGGQGGPQGDGMQDGLDDMREEEADDETEAVPEDMPTPDDLDENVEQEAEFVDMDEEEPSPDDPPAGVGEGVKDHSPEAVQEKRAEQEDDEDDKPPERSPRAQRNRSEEQRQEGGSIQPYPHPINTSRIPSEGRLIPYEQINARLINSKEEVRIKNATPRSMTEVIQDVIQNCTKEDILDLTYGDRLWLYLQLRIESFHQHCYLEVECPHCEQKDPKFPVDLYDLETRSLPDDFEEPMQYRGEDVNLSLRMLRLRAVNKVNNWLKQNAQKERWEKSELDVPELNELARSASMIDEHPDAGRSLSDTIDWLVTPESQGGCSWTEWRILKAFENRYSHGLDFDVTQKCRHCNGDISLTVPMKPQLIYPDPMDSVDLDEFKVEKGNPDE